MQILPRFLTLQMVVSLLALAAGAAQAEDADPTGPAVIIMDGSGSMWGTIGTERASKFDLARGVLRQSLATLSPRVRLGLMSFGQRRRADCSDVEVVAPVEAGPSSRVPDLVDKLNPKGKGPLALALREAGKQIPAGEAGRIIVIHDGVDNCWQDPCGAAAEIAKTNPKTSIYLVGFGLEKGDAQRLACVARSTRGRVIDTQDTAGLASALDEVLGLANLERVDPKTGLPSTTEPAATAKAPAGVPGLRLTASLADGGRPLAADILWRIAKKAEPGVIVRSGHGRELSIDLDAGSYLVEASFGLASAQQTVDVSAEGPTTAQIALGAGTLQLNARADKLGAALADPIVTVTAKGSEEKPGSAVWVGRDAGALLVLPAGTYSVRVEDGAAVDTSEVTITAGGRGEAAPVLGTGRLELSASIAATGAPLDEVVYTIEEDDPDAAEGRREVARSADPHATFTLPAGTYYVRARFGAAEARDRIAINPGETIKHMASLNIARLSVTVQGGEAGQPIVLRVMSDEAVPREVARANAAANDFLLPPARYTIEAAVSGLNITAQSKADLTSARDARIQLRLESGQVSVVGGAGAGVHWRIKDGDGRTVMHSGPGGEPTARLAPGRYVMQTDDGAKRAEATFDLKPGERRELTATR